MDFRHFRYFITAAEELHFARAAERLGIAQPALSQQIKVLETQLGVVLFSRTKKRVELTEAGTAFLAEARATLTSAERAIGVARDTARGELGRIVIGFVGSAMFKPALSMLLKDYRVKHPGVQLELQELVPIQQLEAIQAQHCDIGILRGVAVSALPEGLAGFVLARHRLMAVLPDSHPLAEEEVVDLADLAGEPFLALDDKTSIALTPELLRLCRLAGFDPQVRMRLREIATLVHLVGGGHGVALIPDVAMHLNLQEVVFKPLKDLEAFSDLIAVYRRFERSASVKSLLAQMRKAHSF
jgi:DNA-binding transcriptional LysR family regulator